MYSRPILRALFLLFNMSLTRLYFSMRKVNVGPAGKRMIRREGATGVRVTAMR